MIQSIEKIEASGQKPLARFGHTITQINKSTCILFGGATGDTGRYSFSNETFLFDCANKIWKKLDCVGYTPSPRAAHAATAIETNQLIIYGGASNGGQFASEEIFLLELKENNSQPQWTIIPTCKKSPGKRYGHTINYSRPYLIVFGGNSGSSPINDTWIINVENSPFQWQKLEFNLSPKARAYHSTVLCNQGYANGMLVTFGGRGADQAALNDTWGLRRHRDGNWDWVQAPYKQNQNLPQERYQHSALFMNSAMIVLSGRTNNAHEQLYMEIYDTENSEWYKFPTLQRFRHSCWIYDTNLFVYGGFELEQPNLPTDSFQMINLKQLFQNNEHLLKKLDLNIKNQSPSNFFQSNSGRVTPDIQNRQQARPDSQQVKIDISMKKNDKTEKNLHNIFIQKLLQPKNYIYEEPTQSFPFDSNQIIQLCNQVIEVIAKQPMILKVRSPLKIFGDIHGQYSDLMRFFDLWGTPSDQLKDGDIESFDYLFLGDYVDRGSQSLETILLLLSLKLRYPEQIHLLRGNHEDRCINNGFGFFDECESRLDENSADDNSVFNKINEVFDYMPLAAIVEEKIICLHGGIGQSLNFVEDINTLQRPVDVIHEVLTLEQQLVVDILWSDPTDNDNELGIIANSIRDPQGTGNIVKFGPDRVTEFLKNNNLSMIIRAHECVMDGFERFAGGQLITVFSATDYCGKHKNAGAVLIIKTNLEIIPKLIYPSGMNQQNWIEDEELLKKRPPTPPRWKNGQQK